MKTLELTQTKAAAALLKSAALRVEQNLAKPRQFLLYAPDARISPDSAVAVVEVKANDLKPEAVAKYLAQAPRFLGLCRRALADLKTLARPEPETAQLIRDLSAAISELDELATSSS